MGVDPATLPYRPGVGVMLLNEHNHAWVGRRIDMPGDDEGPGHWWQMPQGGIDEGEEPRDAALRELHEETGVRHAEIIAEAPRWLNYDLPEPLLGVAWKGRFRGQTQKWFAARFKGDESEITIEPPPGLDHKAEFDAWQWAPVSTLPELIVPFKRAVYVDVVAMFSESLDLR
ncbi:MAG: RNA pyrophosphohydrolase [Pseudomonadota bacterium]